MVSSLQHGLGGINPDAALVRALAAAAASGILFWTYSRSSSSGRFPRAGVLVVVLVVRGGRGGAWWCLVVVVVGAQRLTISLQVLHDIVEHDLFLVLNQPMPGVQADGLEGPLDEGRHA